jgi:hypothetical protein
MKLILKSNSWLLQVGKKGDNTDILKFQASFILLRMAAIPTKEASSPSSWNEYASVGALI